MFGRWNLPAIGSRIVRLCMSTWENGIALRTGSFPIRYEFHDVNRVIKRAHKNISISSKSKMMKSFPPKRPLSTANLLWNWRKWRLTTNSPWKLNSRVFWRMEYYCTHNRGKISTLITSHWLSSLGMEIVAVCFYLSLLPGFVSKCFCSNSSHVELRFNLGNGPIVLRSLQPIRLGQWHRIVAQRYRQDGWLRLDDDEDVATTSPGEHSSLDLDTNTYLGAVPSHLATAR